jgi:hypothetical protein
VGVSEQFVGKSNSSLREGTIRLSLSRVQIPDLRHGLGGRLQAEKDLIEEERLVKVLSKVSLPLALLFFASLLIPQSAVAVSMDCPVEPKPDVPISSGDVFAGPNCTLNTTADVDSFVLAANSGDIYRFTVGINTDPGMANLCLTLYSPSAVLMFSACSDIADGVASVVTDQKLTATGVYTMVIMGSSNGAINYGTSLERIYPAPPDGKRVTPGRAVTGNIAPLTDTPAFTFTGVTTSEYQPTAGVPSAATQNLCIAVYSPSGTLVVPSGTGPNPNCTYIAGGAYTVRVSFTPSKAGTYLVLLNEAGDAGTVAYNFEVSCLISCPPPPPPCTLTDNVTYDATTSTLTMDFTVGNAYDTTWHTWLNYQGTMTELFSVSQPITNPPVAVTKTVTLSKEGEVAVISTLTTATKGIVCSSYVKVATGTP